MCFPERRIFRRRRKTRTPRINTVATGDHRSTHHADTLARPPPPPPSPPGPVALKLRCGMRCGGGGGGGGGIVRAVTTARCITYIYIYIYMRKRDWREERKKLELSR